MERSDSTGERLGHAELEALVVSQAVLIAERRAKVAELEMRCVADSRNASTAVV